MKYEPFTYDYYKLFLKRASECSLVTSLQGAMGQDAFIFLRHDVDFSFEYAYRLYEIEREYEVSSTYFFLTTSYTYNIRNPKYRDQLREMVNSGFEVGLHFDPTVYPELSDDELAEKCYFEKGILEEITGREVCSVSLHNPSVHGNYILFNKMLNAYADDIFSDSQYLSDSCFDMRGKDMLEFVAKSHDKKQVLIHPMHWHAERRTYMSIFGSYMDQVKEEIHDGFSVNKTYLSELNEEGS